jgi:hypothetical protein
LETCGRSETSPDRYEAWVSGGEIEWSGEWWRKDLSRSKCEKV